MSLKLQISKNSIKNRLKAVSCLFVIVFIWINVKGQSTNPPFLYGDSGHWVDSVFNSLSPQQRLGQLFMLGVVSNKNKKYEDEIADEICNYNIGGIMFLKGGPMR